MMDKKQCKVKVIIRVRPPLCGTDKPCVNVNNNSIQIFNHRNVTENIQYDFSAVFGMESSQQQIYTDSVKRLLPNALNGQNVSIFAYGPTGAGKTHTMLGTPSNPGVIPRVINGLFQQIEEEKKTEGNEWKYKVSFSYLEIYNEKVQDLLEPSNADLPIREDADKNILIPGLAKKEIHNFDDFSLAFGPASNNRTVAATKLNNHSSRSHSIVQLTVTKSKPCRKLHGKIYLIDLAGSEDNRRTGNKGIRLKESGAINKSLFALGEVVDAINCGLPRIPYRNSKLTRLLQDSVGGSCHSLMITNIAPEERYYYDTYCTLNFATKSKKIVNNTVIKETVGIVKPQPQVRKVPPCPRLSDEETKVKRPRLLDSSSDSLSEEPMPSLSPLMKRQTQLEENVNRRLEELESNLIKQMTSFKPGMQSGDQTPKTKAIQEMQRQLEASHAQLKAIASRHMLPLPSEPPALPAPVPAIITQSQVLKDKTNSLPAQELYKVKKGRPLGGIKRKKEEEFTCSPLFAPPPRVFKKGFTSSATCSSLKDSSVDEEIKTKKQKSNISNSVPFNSVSQQNRNEGFLTVINTSSIKDLQSLQTVGAKRAKLIFEWRETYGLFTQAEDLKKIPGFTEKYLEKLLHSNLITVT